jgi:hypothetical protein
MKCSTRLLILLSVVSGGGCRSQQLAHDQDQFRGVLLDLYTNQIMDNLVRTKNGLPIIQLDYTNVGGLITQNATGNFMNTQTTADSRSLALPAVTRALSHAFTNVAGFSGSAGQTNQLSVTANPLINNNEVYNAYIQFVTMPGRFLATCDPPPPGAAHMVKKCGELYYWIPCVYKYDFFRLSLVTTSQRGQPLSIPLSFDDKVVSTVADDPVPPPGMGLSRFLITFEKKIPNGEGWMTASVNGGDAKFRLQRYDPTPLPPTAPATLDPLPGPKGTVVGLGLPTDTFWLVHDSANVKATPVELTRALKDQPVKIDLDFYKPTVPTTENLLESLRNEAQLIRFNQVNPGLPIR